jgi:uncharacterized protein YkwD
MKQKRTTKKPIRKTVSKAVKPVRKVRKVVKRRTKLLLVPHQQNKYQPHLIRQSSLIAIVLIVFAVQAFYNFSNTGTVLGGRANVTSLKLLELTNQERQKNQRGALEMDTKLANAALLKANDMMKDDYWSHTSPSGETPWQWFSEVDYPYTYAGENLAKNFSSAQGVISAWMRSDEHRRNMLNDNYNDVGFAITSGELQGEQATLVVAMYGTKKPVGALAKTSQPIPVVLAAVDEPQSFIAQLGTHLQAMTPVALASIILLLLAAVVAATAHLYRKMLPKPVLRSWRRHHGLYKAAGMASLAFVFIALYGGGQI